MNSKKWDDAALDRVSAELDAELEEIFAEVDRTRRRSDPEAGLPKAEILPDPDDPPEIEILPDNFEAEEEEDADEPEPVGDFEHISPARDSDIFEADFTVAPDGSAAPEAAYGDFRAGRVGDLTPQEFAKLLERAVERAVLAAISKSGL
ncbi:MAG: hypothetical protein LBV79_08040 [Candidatus Adiutrix sp.]|jgi:hypothetical protein|nr:hypothetical protein [Candidatus Adiutrix sp.]